MRKLLTLVLFHPAARAGLGGQPESGADHQSGQDRAGALPEKAPKSVENFLRYVNDGQYTGTVFHRVIASFMVQGGGFDKTMVERPTRAPIANEANNGLKTSRAHWPWRAPWPRIRPPRNFSSTWPIMNFSTIAARACKAGAMRCLVGDLGHGRGRAHRQTPTTTRGMYQDMPVSAVVIEKPWC